MAKLAPVQLCPICKVIVHSRLNELLCVAMRRKLVHVDDQRDRIATRKFLRPANDEFFRVVIEVPLMKRRWVHGIEELVDFVHKHFNSMRGTALRSFKAAQHFSSKRVSAV